MPKIRTLDMLQETLDAEMAWRLKEISVVKVATSGASAERKVYVRAGIALVYAHWEGFIKAASEAYLSFVDNRGHIYRDLKSCFVVFGLKTKVSLLVDGRKARSATEAVDFLLSQLDSKTNMNMSKAIDTESNLTSSVFANIAASLDISTLGYETKYNLIDESLVKRRNKVAHGNYLDLEPKEFVALADEVVQMMRDYKTDLQNAASQQSYKRPS